MPQLEHIHGGNVTRASLKYGIAEKDLVDFSANINPLGPSRKIDQAIKNKLGMISAYPDPDCLELKAALAEYLGIEKEHLLMGNGAAELIYLFVRVAGCKRALIPVPTFCEYSLSVLSQGGEVIEVAMDEKNDFSLPVAEILKLIPKVDLIFLCSPNNPTGKLAERETIELILDRSLSHGVMVMVDEAFMDFVPHRSSYTMMPQVGRIKNLVVLYSLTKFFGIPGLRLGSIAAPADLIKQMNSAKDPWNVNVLAQVAGIEGLRDQEHMLETNRLVRREKQYLFNMLQSMPGLRPIAGAANFILVDISGSGLTSGEITDLLGRRRIMVRDCHGFTGLAGRYIRLAVKTRPENELLLTAFREILEGGK
ncbi:threonine-phosphate decarboxylase CobD [Pelotomaculum propionicicum]|uniref:threonine-phosphate decarboxylase n=1 Tax=Pelotomaculum propionicicum TaxID=258475 RepID=A0A4Y7RUQ9_9FIRM|nr:threonine-phosphate decarboxylase CobD [Pelotomaculum propionicicum]NLI12681.1 threonine-phosphate decarboxylase [Peptococcaceae bacterium]TEB12603.1 Threonine-phosphate decarboxylase [Pelotomaculum propionicicum]